MFVAWAYYSSGHNGNLKEEYKMITQIKDITTYLHHINTLISKVEGKESLDYSDVRSIYDYFIAIKNTNEIIDLAEKEVKISSVSLYKEAKLILIETESFSTITDNVATKLSSTYIQPLCDKHIEQFGKEYESEKEKATALWNEYTPLSNRLDYMDFNDPEYKQTEYRCNSAKSLYDVSRARVNLLYKSLDEEKRKIAGLYYFEYSFMELVVLRIGTIANSIIADIDNLKNTGVL